MANILTIDDSPEMLEVTAHFLRLDGHNPLCDHWRGRVFLTVIVRCPSFRWRGYLIIPVCIRPVTTPLSLVCGQIETAAREADASALPGLQRKFARESRRALDALAML